MSIQRLALVSILVFSSCATILDGTRSSVTFTSEPPGATVVAGDVHGKTPITLEVSKKTDEVIFSYPGQEDKTIELDSSFLWGYFFLNILVTPGYGATGALVDLITQGWWKHPAQVHCELKEDKGKIHARETKDKKMESKKAKTGPTS